jgi:hypothetical protein
LLLCNGHNCSLAPLGIISNLFFCAIVNNCIYDVQNVHRYELCALLAIRFIKANNCTMVSLDGGRTKLDANLRPSPVNEGLLVDTTFSQIHLDGQYL